MISFLAFPLLLLGSALAQTPQKPSVDGFYKAPAGVNLAQQQPGTILKNRTISLPEMGLFNIPQLGVDVEGVQLLYVTRSFEDNKPIVAVTTLLKKRGTTPTRFVSYQIAEDSANVDCASSYGLQKGATNANTNVLDSFNSLRTYLDFGFALAVPDYEGPDAAFGGRVQGYMVLDGMRAARTWWRGDWGMPIVGTGYSGAAIATGWAASFHRNYASDLNIKGWAIGGTPANLTGTLLGQDGGFFSGFSPIALSGLAKPSSHSAYLQPKYEEILTTYGKERVNYAGSVCVRDAVTSFIGKSILSTDFNIRGRDFLKDGSISLILSVSTLGVNANENPKAPVLLYHGTSDTVVPFADANALYERWCATGTYKSNVKYINYLSGGHFVTETVALGTVLYHVQQFFTSSSSPINSCSIEWQLGAPGL